MRARRTGSHGARGRDLCCFRGRQPDGFGSGRPSIDQGIREREKARHRPGGWMYELDNASIFLFDEYSRSPLTAIYAWGEGINCLQGFDIPLVDEAACLRTADRTNWSTMNKFFFLKKKQTNKLIRNEKDGVCCSHVCSGVDKRLLIQMYGTWTDVIPAYGRYSNTVWSWPRQACPWGSSIALQFIVSLKFILKPQ